MLKWQLGLTIWLLRNRDRYEIIHSCDFDTVLPALLVKLLLNKTVVYDIFDFYSAQLRKTPAWIKRIIRFLELRAISTVDTVILADEVRVAQIEGSNPSRLEFIYNSPGDRLDDLRKQHSPRRSRPPVVAYVGLLQFERGLEYLFEVLEKRPEWRLDLAGFGGDERFILERALPLGNVIWHGRVDYDTALSLCFQADVMIAMYDPAIQNHRYASPNKLYEAMMLGKPIVVARGTHVDEIVQEYECGVCVTYGNVDQLEEALSWLLTDEIARKRLGGNGRLAYESRYLWNAMAKKLCGVYSAIT